MLSNLLEVVGDKWVAPRTIADSICPFDLFFLAQLARHQGAQNITELGCGATTVELSRLGYNLTTFSLEVSKAARKAEIRASFIKCNVMDRGFLSQIIDSVKQSQLLVIDCLHTKEMARYYSENILPHADCLVWIHDYWYTTGYIPYGEQRYLDRNVIGKSHKVWTMTDRCVEDIEVISDQIGHDITNQRHRRPLTKNYGPKMCSVVLEKM